MNKYVLLNSGGFDSVVLAHHIDAGLVEGELHEVHSLTFDYGQRNASLEIACAEKTSEKLGYNQHTLKLPIMNWSSSSLFQAKEYSTDKELVANQYVEMRNLIFLSYAISLAESISDGEPVTIFMAILKEGSGFIDTSPTFITKVNELLNAVYRDKKIQIVVDTPFIDMDKEELGPLAFMYHLTSTDYYSCNEPDENGNPCGVCGDCLCLKEVQEYYTVDDLTSYLFYNKCKPTLDKLRSYLSDKKLSHLHVIKNDQDILRNKDRQETLKLLCEENKDLKEITFHCSDEEYLNVYLKDIIHLYNRIDHDLIFNLELGGFYLMDRLALESLCATTKVSMHLETPTINKDKKRLYLLQSLVIYNRANSCYRQLPKSIPVIFTVKNDTNIPLLLELVPKLIKWGGAEKFKFISSTEDASYLYESLITLAYTYPDVEFELKLPCDVTYYEIDEDKGSVLSERLKTLPFYKTTKVMENLYLNADYYYKDFLEEITFNENIFTDYYRSEEFIETLVGVCKIPVSLFLDDIKKHNFLKNSLLFNSK